MSFYQHGMSLKALLENPELLNPPRKEDDQEKDKEANLDFTSNLFTGQSAFLGPQLWDKTLSYSEADLKLEYMDLDEFLSENCLTDPTNTIQTPQLSPSLQTPLHVSPVAQQLPSTTPPQPPSPIHNQQGPSQLSKLLSLPGTPSSGNSNGLLSPPTQHVPSPQLSPLHGMVDPKCLHNSPQVSPQPAPTHHQQTPQPKQQQQQQQQQQLQQRPSVRSRSPSQSDEEQQDPAGEAKKRPAVAKIQNEAEERASRTSNLKVKVEFEPRPSDLMLATVPGEDFDPRKRIFSEEDLRPQPLIKKSRKVFVPDDMKDDKYWARRRKNNIAARRSRDARRTKENQIAMRALFLETENETLTAQLEKSQRENEELRKRLAKYEPEVAVANDA